MVTVIACVGSETLAFLNLSHQIRENVTLTRCATVPEIFDVIWDRGGIFDMVVVDGAEIEVQDLLVAARNWPGTEFILHDCVTTAPYLKPANIVELGTLTMLRDHMASRCERNQTRQGGLS